MTGLVVGLVVLPDLGLRATWWLTKGRVCCVEVKILVFLAARFFLPSVQRLPGSPEFPPIFHALEVPMASGHADWLVENEIFSRKAKKKGRHVNTSTPYTP
jgi:hypothetical protein